MCVCVKCKKFGRQIQGSLGWLVGCMKQAAEAAALDGWLVGSSHEKAAAGRRERKKENPGFDPEKKTSKPPAWRIAAIHPSIHTLKEHRDEGEKKEGSSRGKIVLLNLMIIKLNCSELE